MIHLQLLHPGLSQQLLDAYFKTAGVCTTSQVQTIRDTGDLVTIDISIEAQTHHSLLAMTEADRDNWFSLHCPPEIHGVWRQENPPDDILVSGQIAPDQTYTSSCMEWLLTVSLYRFYLPSPQNQ